MLICHQNHIQKTFSSLCHLNSQLLLFITYKAPLVVKWPKLIRKFVKELGWIKTGHFIRNLNPNNHYSLKNKLPKIHKCSTNRAVIRSKSENMWKWFLQVWTFTSIKRNILYASNRDFRVMFVSSYLSNGRPDLVSPERYYMRWVEVSNLLNSLFRANSQIQVLSNKVFTEESLVFNWHYSSKNYKLFKLIQPFFSFSDIKHGGYVQSAIQLVRKFKVDWLLIIDLNYHKNLLGYFQKVGFYSIGLVPVNYSPWKVSYPVPTFADSKVSQYYFIRWVLNLKLQSTVTLYDSFFKNYNRVE